MFGGQASVIFVNTAAALRAARDAGARQACLDSSDAGLSIYRRLRFEIVARMMRLSGPD